MSILLHLSDLLLDGKEPIDDSIDKIHRRCTIVFLLLLSLPLFTKQFAGEPIECFTPTYFTEAQSRYVNSYCWTVSTFYLDPHIHQQNSELKRSSSEAPSGRIHSVDYSDEYDTITASTVGQEQQKKNSIKVNYYQWAPMILVMKAITFYIPFALWKGIARRRGISLRHLMKRITRMSLMDWSHPDRAASLREVVEQVHIVLQEPTEYLKPNQQELQQNSMFHKKRLFLLFLLVKVLYFFNVLFQFYLLVCFLGEDYLTHGFSIIRHLWTKNQWWISPRFPLQTLCSVRAAQQGSLRLYQCHCVLPINLFTEKICSVWWFYVAALLPLTFFSIISWSIRGFHSSSRLDFVTHYLVNDASEKRERSFTGNFSVFVFDYLGIDGIFLLRLIEINHGSTVLSVIIRSLYERSIRKVGDIPIATQAALSSITAQFSREEAPGHLSTYQGRERSPRLAHSPLTDSMIRRLVTRPSAHAVPLRRMRSRMSLQIHPTSVV